MQSAINDPSYQRFIAQIVQEGCVYALTDEDDFYAECPSEMYESNLGEDVMISCFWDNKTDALNCIGDEWQHYSLTEIDLTDFINEVLPECYEDQRLLGISFDAQLYGLEVEAIDVLGDLLMQIEQQNQTEDYPHFSIWLKKWQSWQNEQNKQRIIH